MMCTIIHIFYIHVKASCFIHLSYWRSKEKIKILRSLTLIHMWGLDEGIGLSIFRNFHTNYCKTSRALSRPLVWPWGSLMINVCLLHEVDSQLFKSMQNSQHCINCLFPDTRNTAYFARRRNHPCELPYYHYSWYRCSFVNRSLYNFILCIVFLLYYMYFELLLQRMLMYVHMRFVVCN